MKTLFFLCFTLAPSLYAVTFYVAPPPTGSDTAGTGTAASPWATFPHAASSLRPLLPAMASNITILFSPGAYPVPATIALTAADSGRNGFFVTYAAAAAAGSALLDGGIALPSWEELPCCSGVFSALLPFPTREVYANGARVAESVAKGINLTSENTQVTAEGYETTDAALLSAITAPSSLALAGDVELLYTSAGAQWQEARCRVASWALGAGNTSLSITMAQPGWNLTRGKGYPETFPTAVVNLFAPLQLGQGEGVISPSRGRVYYRPPAALPVDAWAAALDGELLLLQGAANVIVEGLAFRGSTWLAPTVEGAYAPDQGGIVYAASDLGGSGKLLGHATHPVPGAVTLRASTNVSLLGITVEHVGGTGIAVEGGSQGCMISRALVRDAGCSGVRFGQVDDAGETNPAAMNAGLTLEDSVLHGLAQGYRDCSGVFGGFVRDTEISHNEVRDANWAGLTLGWGGWGGAPYRPSLGGNRVVGNAITNVNLITGDGGPIYVMSQQQSEPGCGAGDFSCRSEITGNFVGYAMHHAAMLYHDEGSEFFYTHGNVVDQPANLTDPHGWWWSWAAAWADTERNILIRENFARGVNRSDLPQNAAQLGLVIENNFLLADGAPWPAAAAAIIAQAGPRPAALR